MSSNAVVSHEKAIKNLYAYYSKHTTIKKRMVYKFAKFWQHLMIWASHKKHELSVEFNLEKESLIDIF